MLSMYSIFAYKGRKLSTNPVCVCVLVLSMIPTKLCDDNADEEEEDDQADDDEVACEYEYECDII